MGNRAVITADMNGLGVYLQWNGGRDSVEPFLKYCEMKGFRSPDLDPAYGYARLAMVIGNFFGGSLSIGVDLCSRLDCDNMDNGVYIIKGWEIVGRKYHSGREQAEHDFDEMLEAIDEAQPESQQLGPYLKAREIPTSEAKAGDTVVYIDPLRGTVKNAKIVGIGEDRYVNGSKVKGIPYMDAYCPEHPESNPNNYIKTEKIRVLRDTDENDGKKKETPKPKKTGGKRGAADNSETKAVEMYINEELNGIELKFRSRPPVKVREAMKAAGFRWHHRKALWYVKRSPERLDFAQALVKELTKQ